MRLPRQYGTVLFLVSDEARYLTGVPLPVDAGALLR
jgi:NAD(P)-dependent dehydrogenase (short-subunit alcohol dehydrogenase family)